MDESCIDIKFLKKWGYTLDDFEGFTKLVLDHICNKKRDLQILNKNDNEYLLPQILNYLVHQNDIKIKVVTGMDELSIIYSCNNPK